MTEPYFPEDGFQEEINAALGDRTQDMAGPPVPDEFWDTRTGMDKRSPECIARYRADPDLAYFDPLTGLDMRSAEFKAIYPSHGLRERILERLL